MALSDEIISGLISGGAGIVSSLFGFGASKHATDQSVEAVKEQNAGNMRLAEYQYEKNLEQWYRQNEYNSPAAQMERYKAAGLNPNLIYGNGASSAGNAASSPQYQAPHLDAYTDFSRNAAALSGIMDQALKVAQIHKTAQETDNLKQYQKNMQADEEYRKLQSIGQGYANAKTKEEAAVYKELMRLQLDGMFLNNLLTTYKGMDTLITAQNKEKYQGRLFEEQLAHSVADRTLMQYKAASLAADVGLKQATANRIMALLPYEETSFKLSNGLKGIEYLVQKNARRFGINPNNNSEIGAAANFIVGMLDFMGLTDDEEGLKRLLKGGLVGYGLGR